MEVVGGLKAGPDACLASHLLQDLARGQEHMYLDSPSRALPDLPRFLDKTGIWRLTVRAENAAASAQVDRVLQHCSGIRHLNCGSGFMPNLWSPALEQLELQYWHANNAARAQAMVVSQHVQLVRLQDAAGLQRLEIVAGGICDWPASICCPLPASLQQFHVILVTEGAECSFDLSAFTPAAGCTAEVHVVVVCSHHRNKHLGTVLAALAGLPRVEFLELTCLHEPIDPQQFILLGQVQCDELTLHVDSHAITHLPAVRHLTLEFRGLDWTAGGVVCEWSALTGAGVRYLGICGQPVHELRIVGYNEAPVHEVPWALVIWGDMNNVQGVPAAFFEAHELVPSRHVWRNAAAGDIWLSNVK